MLVQKYLRGGVVLVALGAAACSGETASEGDAAQMGAVGDVRETSKAPGSPAIVGDPASGDFAPDSDDGAISDEEGSGAAIGPSMAAPETAGGLPAPGSAGTTAAAPLPHSTPDPDAPTLIAPGEEPAAPMDPIEAPDEPTPAPSPSQAGQLTAGVWDDNRNFERFISFRDPMFDDQMDGLLDFDVQDHEAANEQFKELGDERDTLDIALVIDTTGSMGDEMAFLQTEIQSISMRIEKVYPDAEQRWALIVYRDVGDAYVAQAYDFTTDPDSFRDNLAEQYVDGGGDFPEAPDAALAAMNELSWREGDSNARLAFWVADAPHHAEHAADMTASVAGAQEREIHVYPVASSGIDEFTELLMRSTAQLTGGRYIFLTDDSGIGGDHKEPSIPCYFVTRLDVAMLRMVDIEMSGTYKEPADDEIIRTGGDPQDGACTLSSGNAVFIF